MELSNDGSVQFSEERKWIRISFDRLIFWFGCPKRKKSLLRYCTVAMTDNPPEY